MDSKSSDQYELRNEMYDELDEHGFTVKKPTKVKPERNHCIKIIMTFMALVQLLILLLLIGLIALMLTGKDICKATVLGDTTGTIISSDQVLNISMLSDSVAEKVIDLFNNCTAEQKEIGLALQNVIEDVLYIRNMVDDQIKNNKDTVNLIKQASENTTQKLSDIADAFVTLHKLADEEIVYSLNNTNTVDLIKQSTENTTQKLINIVSTLNNLKGTSTSTAGVADDILLVVEELNNASVLFNSVRPVSCKDIKTVLPNSPTGYYHVNSRNIYCNMGELCGTGGGWTRLAYLDMSDSTVNCPTGFRLYQSGGVRACGRLVSSGPSCSSSGKYPSNGISYSQICGRVVGYQYGSTDASYPDNGLYINDINSYYVDGISITHGSPRQHVWTLMSGLLQSYYHHANCPCNTPPGSTEYVQSFIGSNYFCESGNPNSFVSSKLYTSDPLWDGQGCGAQEGVCCSAPGLPWFHRDYGNVTMTDYIELRICGRESTSNDDVPVSFYEIYVQ